LSGLGAQQGIHLLDQFAQMERLGENRCVARRWTRTGQRHRRKTGDENHLEVGIEFGGTTRKLDTIHLRHDDVRQQQSKWLFAEPGIGLRPVGQRNDGEPGAGQLTRQERAHRIVVLGKQDTVRGMFGSAICGHGQQ